MTQRNGDRIVDLYRKRTVTMLNNSNNCYYE